MQEGRRVCTGGQEGRRVGGQEDYLYQIVLASEGEILEYWIEFTSTGILREVHSITP